MTAISAWHATEGLSSRQVCERVGITYRQLDYMLRTGVAWSSVHQSGGYGTARRFSEDDVARIATIAVVRRLIVAWEASPPVIEFPTADRWLVITDSGAVTCGAGELERIAEGGGIVVDLGAARA